MGDFFTIGILIIWSIDMGDFDNFCKLLVVDFLLRHNNGGICLIDDLVRFEICLIVMGEFLDFLMFEIVPLKWGNLFEW